MKTSWEIDGNGYVQPLDDWTTEEQRRERSSQYVIGGVVISLLVVGSYMISLMLQRM